MKKFLLSALALVAVAALAITGTIAYLQNEDSDKNVMTLGSVKIAQHEYERDVNEDGTYKTAEIDNRTSYVLRDFTQDKPLYPAIIPNGGTVNGVTWAYDAIPVRMSQVGSHGGASVFNTPNAVDKFVTVENTGKSDAYVRTLIAFEMGELTEERFGEVIATEMRASKDADGKQPWHIVSGEVFAIDGNRYYVFELVYNGALTSNGWKHEGGVLPAGETTYPSLCQVYMAAEATNEDVEAIDGNGNGTFEIYVMSQAVQVAGFESADDAFENSGAVSVPTAAKIALDTAFGEPTATNVAAWVFDAEEAYQTSLIDEWDGTADTSWYNDTDAEFVIMTAEQLAGFAKLVDDGNTFEGKTVKLGKDIELKVMDENGEPICLDPIGSYRFDKSFKGTFDGQGHTISNLAQNTWALNNGYYNNDCGLGLFGAVEDGTVKNLTIDGAEISGQTAICGTIAAVAHNATFENITVKNANVADYQYYSGGIAGWASGEITVTDCVLDASTNVAAQWGDFDNSTGGVIGGASGSAEILIKDTTVACRIDAYNDVTSSYQWYAYRRCGMLIGNSGKTKDVNGTTVADAPQLTCENVTVIYGDWANYTYCEFAGTSWPYVRVQAGVSNSAYSNPRYGHPTDANGNEVVDDNHVHNQGEDHFIECTFNQLYGGGQGVYGTATHDGVTVVYNNK